MLHVRSIVTVARRPLIEWRRWLSASVVTAGLCSALDAHAQSATAPTSPEPPASTRGVSTTSGPSALAPTVGVPAAGAIAAPPPAAPVGSAEVPARMTLDDALRIFRARGFDLLIAEAAVVNAQGDVLVAGAVPNPSVSAGYGRIFNYDPTDYPSGSPEFPNGQPCIGCSKNSYSVGISDQAAISDTVSGKRDLRLRVARKALTAAKLARIDAQRTLELQVKQQFVAVAFAKANLAFAREVRESNAKTFNLNKLRYEKGQIDEGTLARVHVTALEAEQAVEVAEQGLRASRIALAFLLGVRTEVPDYDVDFDLTRSAVPAKLADANEAGLVQQAFARRPDLLGLGVQRERAQAAIELVKRQRIPDFTLSLTYTQTGTGQNAIQPPTLLMGVSMPLPLFYQLEGEVKKAQADLATQTFARGKVEAQVVADVSGAYASFVSSRKLVERMESSLLERARTARDITERQWRAGSATFMDFLDATRQYIATNVEYLQDLTTYWTAVFQLEQAVGTELRK